MMLSKEVDSYLGRETQPPPISLTSAWAVDLTDRLVAACPPLIVKGCGKRLAGVGVRAWLGVIRQAGRWNHNVHYYPLIVAAVPPGCQRALDVGCGEGTLARHLAGQVPHVSGIDTDAQSIELARRQDPAGKIDLIRGDFLAHPFEPGSFGMITSVAALHHMDPAAALGKMSRLLQPGETLAIVGLARPRLPADLPWEAAAVIANLGYRLTRAYWEHPSPIVWPPPHTYAAIRRLAARSLPGVRYRRHVLWRYSLVWTKPGP